MLISSLAVQVFHCLLFVHFFLLGMMPQSHQSWGLSASFYLFLEFVTLSSDRTTCSLFRSQTEFILNDFILTSLFRKFNCLLKFSFSNNLLTQDLLQELDLPCLPIHYWGLPRTPWGKRYILHWIRIPGLDFITNLRETERRGFANVWGKEVAIRMVAWDLDRTEFYVVMLILRLTNWMIKENSVLLEFLKYKKTTS